jgi:hypothetical protein
VKAPGAAVLAAVVALGAVACATTSHSTSPSMSDPQATSIVTPEASFATLAMGNRSDPGNTFWQLMVRPHGSTTWSDQVEATAVATNGGIILAAGPGTVQAAARPTNLLSFTPLIATIDGGRSWVSDGLVPTAVAATPNSVAAGTEGLLAIASGRVQQRAPGSNAWTTLATIKDLQSAKACRPTAITAVAFAIDQPVIGVACARSGSAGVLIETGGSWALAGPEISQRDPVRVLGLAATGPGLTALLQAGNQVLAAWRTSAGWTVSAPLPSGDPVSAGPAAGGWFVLGPDLALHTVAAGAAGWDQLPPAPRGTATVVVDGTTDALAVDSTGTVLTVWSLAPNGAGWVETQTLKVPIQFGSSG